MSLLYCSVADTEKRCISHQGSLYNRSDYAHSINLCEHALYDSIVAWQFSDGSSIIK
jgi:hypothetical protein